MEKVHETCPGLSLDRFERIWIGWFGLGLTGCASRKEGG